MRRRVRRVEPTPSIGYNSSSSSTSTSRSSESNSTWNGWRFWKNSSSGSSSGGTDRTEDDWLPPTPHFTLLTPCQTRSTDSSYPAHLAPGAAAAPNSKPTKPVFDLITASTIVPVLSRLETYWSERKQEDPIGGDVGAGPMGTEDDDGYFPYANADFSATATPIPAVTPGIASGRKLRGEARAAKAEAKRGNHGGDEQGAAWWLDVMCPTVADLRELRKIVPLHPLTMEDIIHQETREKIETFPTLGYYFVVFRGLDESYFKYTSPDVAPASTANVSAAGKSARSSVRDLSTAGGRNGRVDIIEGVGGKEGVEGVGVGAINLYLCVFRDGIISFHFEDISKHIDRVQGKLQQFGTTRSMSSNWIAYGLMDSVVDAFFPLINFIEGESNDVANFLCDPANTASQNRVIASPSVVVPLVNVKPVLDSKTDSSSSSKKDSDSTVDLPSLSADPGGGRGGRFRMTMIKRRSLTSVLRIFPLITISPVLSRLLPESWTKPAHITLQSTMLVDASGFVATSALPQLDESDEPRGDSTVIDPKLNRAEMLKKIADVRKLVTGLSRLMGTKADVVRGMRKRTKDAGLTKMDPSHDISIYIGDLLDHSIAMQQSLNFYEAILSHDHLAYLGILRLSLNKAKHGIDYALVKLYIVTLTILPINLVVGLFSLNINEPRNGARGTHLEPDGVTLSGFSVFYTILGSAVGICFLMWTIVYLIFRSSHNSLKRRHSDRIELAALGKTGPIA